MRLLIDIGSSVLKWCCSRDTGIDVVEAVLYKEINLQSYLQQQWQSLTTPESVYVSHVGDEAVLNTLAAWVAERWQVPLHRIVAERQYAGVSNAYRNPQQLGSDRWLNLIAAHQLHRGNSVIVDAGTAMTIDVLDSQGRHHGGLIIPGLYRQRQMLLSSAGVQRAMTTPPDEQQPEGHDWLASDTAHAIDTGCVYAMAAMIDRVCVDTAARFATPVQCLLTGADASALRAQIQHAVMPVENLVLRGLACITALQENH